MDARRAAAAPAGAPMTDLISELTRALHPLDTPPACRGANREYPVGLIGDAPRRDAAVLVGVRDVPDPRVIFTLRCDDLVHHAGQVSFPGGSAEAGDLGAVATALRESHEEIALDPKAVEPLGFLDALETISGFRVTPVVARLAHDAVLVPQPGEVAQIFEVPLTYLLEPSNVREFDYRSHGLHRKAYEYVGVAPRIWGATARMLVNLMRRMGRMR